MKLRRFFSSVLFAAGCGLTFIALLSILLPNVQNQQIQLIVSSFETPSDHPAVQAMNEAMRFALQQNWRLLYLGLLILASGIGLLLHFSPRAAKQKSASPAAAAPVQENLPEEKLNPYAAVSYYHPVKSNEPAVSEAFTVHPEPVPEYSQMSEEEAFPADAPPFFSPHFAQESSAIRTENGSQSQSGAHLLIRSAYQPAAAAESQSPNRNPASAPAADQSKSPEPIPSARIRSTMGRHGNRIHK